MQAASVNAWMGAPHPEAALSAAAPHIESLARYGHLVENQINGLLAGKLLVGNGKIGENTRAQLQRTTHDLLDVFQRALAIYTAEYRAQFETQAPLDDAHFRRDERVFARCTDDAMRLLHTISSEFSGAREWHVRRMIDRLVGATARLRALSASAAPHRRDAIATLVSTDGAQTAANVRGFMGSLVRMSQVHVAGNNPDRAFMRTDRLRREHDICGWDPAKAKPGAVYVIAGNWDSTLFSAFTASRIARRMSVSSPVFSASSIASAKAGVLSRSAAKTAMATIGVEDESALNYAHFPIAAQDDCFELARELAAHYGASREVYVVDAITNGLAHRTLPHAPPLRTELAEPELVSPTADAEWVASKRTAFQNACDAQQTIVDLATPAFSKKTAWPLSVGAATAIGLHPSVSLLGAFLTTAGIKSSTRPLFSATNEASRTMISSYGVDRKATGAPTLVTPEEQAAYEAFNARLAKKYPDLEFMLRDPEQFLATMRARYAAQRQLTPEDPYRFDYSEIGLPLVQSMMRSLDTRIVALEQTLKRTNKKSVRRDIELGLNFYRELCVECSGYLSAKTIDYRRLHELSFFFSRAVGHFDIDGLSVYKRGLLRMDRSQQGYEPLPLEQEYALYKDSKFSIFQKPTYVNGLKMVQSWFEEQFAKTDELTMVSVPTHSELGTDIFHRLAWYPIHMMGVAVDGPIPADGFLRPAGDFWNHDMRHASIILSEMVKYVDEHKLTPQQLEKMRKASDVWYERYRARLKDVKNPKLKRAIQMTYFNLHHEQGYPLAASSYARAHEGLHLSKGLGFLLAISGQTDKNKGGTPGEVAQAYEWLVDFWRTVEADETAILTGG